MTADELKALPAWTLVLATFRRDPPPTDRFVDPTWDAVLWRDPRWPDYSDDGEWMDGSDDPDVPYTSARLAAEAETVVVLALPVQGETP